MSLQFSVGDAFDAGRGASSSLVDVFAQVLGAATPSLIDIFTGRDDPTRFGPIFPEIGPAIGGFLGGGNGVCPIEVVHSKTNPGGPPESTVWRRIEGCADRWARVPVGFKPVIDCCGNVSMRKVRRRRRGISARDVSGAARVSKFVSTFGVKSKVPTKRKGRRK